MGKWHPGKHGELCRRETSRIAVRDGNSAQPFSTRFFRASVVATELSCRTRPVSRSDGVLTDFFTFLFRKNPWQVVVANSETM